MLNKKITIIFFTLFCISSNVSALTVQARRSLPSGVEEISLNFKNNQAIWVANSDFFSLSKNGARLGVFTISINKNSEIFRIQNELKMIKKRTDNLDNFNLNKNQLKLVKENSPHSLKISIANKVVSPGSKYYQLLVNIFNRAVRLQDWVCRECVSYLKADNNQWFREITNSRGDTQKTIARLKDICRPNGKKDYFCKDEKFGHFYLRNVRPHQ